jgi:hypothetical protein
MTYTEKSQQVVLESQIAVMLFLNPDNTDLEMWPLRPRQVATTSHEEFAARKLRTVGVVGLSGTKGVSAFKEPLESAVVDGISTAFLEYVRVLIGDNIAMQIEEWQKGDEVAWLEQLHLLPDMRMN